MGLDNLITSTFPDDSRCTAVDDQVTIHWWNSNIMEQREAIPVLPCLDSWPTESIYRITPPFPIQEGILLEWRLVKWHYRTLLIHSNWFQSTTFTNFHALIISFNYYCDRTQFTRDCKTSLLTPHIWKTTLFKSMSFEISGAGFESHLCYLNASSVTDREGEKPKGFVCLGLNPGLAPSRCVWSETRYLICVSLCCSNPRMDWEDCCGH